MNTKSSFPELATLTALCIFLSGPSLFSANLVQNPSFETPSVGGGWRYQPGGASWTFTPWSGIVGHVIDWGNPVAPDGAQSAILQSVFGVNSQISQAISGLTVGQSYTVKFFASQRPNPGFFQNQDFNVLFDNTVVGHFQPSGTTFQEFTTAPFTATAATHTLRFVGLNSAGYINTYGDNTALIDNVRVEANPTDLIATDLAWDTANGGVNFFYEVAGADLTVDTTAALYWATGPTWAAAAPFPAYSMTIELQQDIYGPYYVPNPVLGTPPQGATHLLLVVDPPSTTHPNGLVEESNDFNTGNNNNVFPLALPGDIRPTDLKIVSGGVEISYVIENSDLSDLPYVGLSWDAGPTPPTQTVPAAHIRLANTAMSAPGTKYTELLQRGDFSTPIPPSGFLTYVRAVIDAQDADPSNNSLSARMTITAPQMRSFLMWHNTFRQSSCRLEADDFRADGSLQWLIDESLRNSWDPRFILGIAGAESTFGSNERVDLVNGHPVVTCPPLAGTFNYWGLMDTVGNPLNFSGWPQAVIEAASRPSSPAYNHSTRVSQFGPIYTLTEVRNWISTVSGVMQKLGYSPFDDEATSAAGSGYYFSPGTASFRIYSPATLYLIDPLGRIIGSAGPGAPLSNSIPGSVVQTNGVQIEGIWLPAFTSGEYRLYLLGTDNGSYKLDVTFIHPSADFSGTTIEGQITQGAIQEFLINVTTNDPGQTTATQILSPVCNAGGPYTAECGGFSTTVRLDGTGSTDPTGSTMTFLWTTDCPGAVFDNPASPTPTMTLNSGTVPENCSVTLTVSNPFGLSSSCSATVTVKDTKPPQISTVTATPSVLWPPNNKMVDVTINYTPADGCDPAANITSTLDVTSNEQVRGCHRDHHGRRDPGYRDKDRDRDDRELDWVVLDSHHLRLRAEKAERGEGRIYWITVTCKDSSGNSASKKVTVTVPKSQGPRH